VVGHTINTTKRYVFEENGFFLLVKKNKNKNKKNKKIKMKCLI